MNKKKEDIIFKIIMVLVILLGLTVITFSIKSIIDINDKTKNYISIEATFEGVSFENDEGGTYGLGYVYTVDGKTYHISTDYSTSIIPEEGSTKTIKYNPEDPNDAVITGYGTEMLVIVIGFMFVSIPLVFIMNGNDDKKDKLSSRAKKTKSFITSFLIGVTFIGMGSGVYYLMCDGTNGLSLGNLFKNAGIFGIIPVIFILLGIYMLIYTLFAKRVKEVIIKVDGIQECEDGTYDVIFSDESIDMENLKTIIYKYFIYNTENKDKFEIDKKFKVNIYKYGIMLEIIPVSELIQARSLKQFEDKDFEETIV